MTQPLELTVYPKLERPTRGDQIIPYQEQWRAEQSQREQKLLTDAELAAEYWHASDQATYARSRVDAGLDNHLPLSADDYEDLEKVMHRFATHPHHDEQP